LETAAFHQRSQQGFRDLYDRYDAPARQKSPRLADTLPSAWSNAYTAYWSQSARVRYQCLCAIDTFLLTIAKRQEWKARQRDIPLDTDDRSIDPASPDAGPEEEVSTHLDAATIRTAWMEQLTARERLTVELVEARQLSQKEAAAAMGVTEARISQLLSSANQKLSALRTRFDGEPISFAKLRKAP
jgi:RNA polymerase sigma factor (sigma-70 family)